MDDHVETGRLKRSRHPMPGDLAALLAERDLLAAYRRRPAYQQNDYIGWINRARRGETRQKRIKQMLEELERGGVYMKMPWNG